MWLFKRHPDKVGFLVAHPYQNDFSDHNAYLAHDGETTLVKRTSDAVAAIRKHGRAYKDKIPVIVTEGSSFAFKAHNKKYPQEVQNKAWHTRTNDMTKALCWFEMAADMLLYPEVRYIHFWTVRSHWWSSRNSVIESRRRSDFTRAFAWDNSILPMRFAQGILAKSLRNDMVEGNRVSGPVRTYASVDSKGLSVWLMNKDHKTQVVALDIPDRRRYKKKDVKCFRGKNGLPEDLEYTFTNLSQWRDSKNGITIALPSCSVTVIHFDK